jgi:hypothetical protein
MHEPMNEDQHQLQFNKLQERVFSDNKGRLLLGGEEIKPELRDVLRQQAHNLKTSDLYDILRSTILNESANIALIQSKDYEQVQFAKALYHWQFVLDNILNKLSDK